MQKGYVKDMLRILKKHRIRKAALFGSFARGSQNSKSDIDLLIDPPQKFTLFDIAELKRELEGSVKREVDLITFRSINKLLEPYIKKDMKMIM